MKSSGEKSLLKFTHFWLQIQKLDIFSYCSRILWLFHLWNLNQIIFRWKWAQNFTTHDFVSCGQYRFILLGNKSTNCTKNNYVRNHRAQERKIVDTFQMVFRLWSNFFYRGGAILDSFIFFLTMYLILVITIRMFLFYQSCQPYFVLIATD